VGDFEGGTEAISKVGGIFDGIKNASKTCFTAGGFVLKMMWYHFKASRKDLWPFGARFSVISKSMCSAGIQG